MRCPLPADAAFCARCGTPVEGDQTTTLTPQPRLAGSGRLAVIGELYERRRTLEELLPFLLELHARYGIETFAADPSEPAYLAQCRAADLPVTKAENAVLPGITAVSAGLAAVILRRVAWTTAASVPAAPKTGGKEIKPWPSSW